MCRLKIVQHRIGLGFKINNTGADVFQILLSKTEKKAKKGQTSASTLQESIKSAMWEEGELKEVNIGMIVVSSP